MTLLSETAADHQMVPEYDQIIPHWPAADPAAVTVTDGPQPAGSAARSYRAAPAVHGAAGEPAATDDTEAAGEPAATSDTEMEIPPAVAALGALPESIRDIPAVTDDTSPGVRWPEIQATFVDDPRACVELAAGVVDGSVEAFVLSVRERQRALLSAWQRGDAGTEQCALRSSHTALPGTVSRISPARSEQPPSERPSTAVEVCSDQANACCWSELREE